MVRYFHPLKSVIICKQSFAPQMVPSVPYPVPSIATPITCSSRSFSAIQDKMCIMMLDLHDWKSQFFCNDCRVIFWMQITCCNFRFYLQKCLESVDRLLHAFTVRRSSRSLHTGTDRNVHPPDTERILESSSACGHAPVPFHGNLSPSWEAAHSLWSVGSYQALP